MGKYAAVEGKLITEVERHPVIWQPTDPNFKNKALKENAWSEIADIVNSETDSQYSVTEYRDKIWKNIRDTYVRLLNGHYKKAGSMTDKSPKYHYMQSVTFLNPYIGTRSQSYDRRQITTKEESAASVDVDQDIEIVELGNPTENGDTEMPRSKQGTKRPHEPACVTPEQVHQAVNDRLNDYLSKVGKKKERVGETDADGLFGQSVAAQLREMDGRQNAIAKARIQMILAELKYPECAGLTAVSGHALYDTSEKPERCTMVDLSAQHTHLSRPIVHVSGPTLSHSNSERSFTPEEDT